MKLVLRNGESIPCIQIWLLESEDSVIYTTASGSRGRVSRSQICEIRSSLS